MPEINHYYKSLSGGIIRVVSHTAETVTYCNVYGLYRDRIGAQLHKVNLEIFSKEFLKCDL